MPPSMMTFEHEKDDEVILERDVEEAFDDDDVDATDGDIRAKLREVKEILKQTQKERKEYLDGWQRSKADYLNLSKRFDEERQDIRERAEAKLIEKMLPLCDSFDMALTQTEATGGAWKEGLERIYSQMRTILSGLDVEAIGVVGSPFNPHEHEALSSQPVEDEVKHDTVVAVLQKGYRRKETLIRPAKVVIGTYEQK